MARSDRAVLASASSRRRGRWAGTRRENGHNPGLVSDSATFEREADVAISNTIEAGLGALWGEDPRYFRAPHGSVRSRAAHAIKTVVLAPRPDGQFKPAWGRFAGNVVNNVIENAWLPPSVTTPGQTALRSANGCWGRLAGNLWDEFWPDVRSRLSHRVRHSTE